MRDLYGEELKRKKERRQLVKAEMASLLRDAPELEKRMKQAAETTFYRLRRQFAREDKVQTKPVVTKEKIATWVTEAVVEVIAEKFGSSIRKALKEYADPTADKAKARIKIDADITLGEGK